MPARILFEGERVRVEHYDESGSCAVWFEEDEALHVARAIVERLTMPVCAGCGRSKSSHHSGTHCPAYPTFISIDDAIAYAASCDRSPEGEKPQALSAQHESAVPRADEADAQGDVGSTPSPTGEL